MLNSDQQEFQQSSLMRKLQSSSTDKSLENPLPSSLKILSVTWNLVGSVPIEKYLSNFFDSQQFQSKPDVIFIGTQECQLSLFWSFFWDSKYMWQETLTKHLKDYDLFATHTLQGLHNAILIHNNHKQNTFFIQKQVLRAGFCCNLFGNKGAVSIKIKIYGQYLQFINCHLAPHQDNAVHRNQTLMRILHKLVCKRSYTEVILLGDMNYRIQMKNQEYKKFLKNVKVNTEEKVKYSKFFVNEQLRSQEQLKQNFFPFFEEGDIGFPPTYKLCLQSDEYNKKRVPGWTDRIFNRKGKIIRKTYECLYKNYGSDHRPVLSLFQLDLEQGISIFEDEAFANRSCQII